LAIFPPHTFSDAFFPRSIDLDRDHDEGYFDRRSDLGAAFKASGIYTAVGISSRSLSRRSPKLVEGLLSIERGSAIGKGSVPTDLSQIGPLQRTSES